MKRSQSSRSSLLLASWTSAARLISTHGSLDRSAISYNGGKDCKLPLIHAHSFVFSRIGMAGTVLVHLVAAVLSRRSTDLSPSQQHQQLKALYVRCPSPFPQVEEFIRTSSAYYDLDLVRISAGMKQALSEYKKSHSAVEAVIVGTRRTDPHGGEASMLSLMCKYT